MNIEHLYITNKHNRALNSRQQYDKTRNSLIELLGSKCVKCGIKDIRVLQIDHKNGFGKKNRLDYSNVQSMYRYYVNNPIFALSYLQLLCANCNWIKRFENNEDNKQKYADRKFRKYESRQRFILGKNKRKVYIWEK